MNHIHIGIDKTRTVISGFGCSNADFQTQPSPLKSRFSLVSNCSPENLRLGDSRSVKIEFKAKGVAFEDLL